MSRTSSSSEIFAGAVAGVLATCPMTRLMEALDGSEIEQPDSALPPRKITTEALHVIADEPPPEAAVRPATVVAHYGYGGTVGSFYPLLQRAGALSPLVSGAAFGLGVWAVSYLGLLPALGSSARATNRSQRVNGIMIAAHLVWGISLAALVETQLRLLSSRADEAEA